MILTEHTFALSLSKPVPSGCCMQPAEWGGIFFLRGARSEGQGFDKLSPNEEGRVSR